MKENLMQTPNQPNLEAVNPVAVRPWASYEGLHELSSLPKQRTPEEQSADATEQAKWDNLGHDHPDQAATQK